MFQLLLYVLLYQAYAAQQLLQVSIYIRHGIRTQYFGRWNPKNLGENELGQLTPGGIRQMYNLGQSLRKDYFQQLKIGILPHYFNQIYVRSTDLNRSMMSAHVLNYAMLEQQIITPFPIELLSLSFPPIDKINKEIYLFNNQSSQYWPLPYHTLPRNLDSLLLGWDPAPCPVITLLNERNQKSKEMNQVYQLTYIQANLDWEPFFQQMRNKKLMIYDIVQAGELADDMFSSILSGEQVPPDLTQSDLVALDYLRNIYYQITDFNHYNQVRFQATPFIKDLIKRFDEWNQTQMLIYVGHDNNIFQILNLLNLTSWECVNDKAKSTLPQLGKLNILPKTTCEITSFPQFGSQAVFELWTSHENLKEIHDQENYYIKFKYNGKYYPFCHDKKLSCPYHKFKTQIQPLIFKDYEEKCQILGINDQSQRATVMIFTIMLFVFSFLFLIVGFNYKKQLEMESLDDSPQRECEMQQI